MGSFNGNVFITYKPQDSSSRMSDIEYLLTQEFNGNLIRLEGEINAMGETLAHIIPAGKDAYILVAKIIPSKFTPAAASLSGNRRDEGNNHTEASISRGGPTGFLTELDRVTVGMSTTTRAVRAANNGPGEGTGGSGYGSMTDGIFHAAVGAKATATQRLEIKNTFDHGDCRAQMVILQIDAGTSPRI